MNGWQRHTLFALLILQFSSVAAGPTLTMGGQVSPAADTTSADLGSWMVYDPASSTMKATGIIGMYNSNYWAGEVGHMIDGISIGDDFIAVLEKETGTGTLLHAGYHAIVQHTLDNSDPAEFPATQISPIPVPLVDVQSTSQAQLSWSSATGGAAIAGYNIYRSDDGINFSQVNASTVTGFSYTDTTFNQYTRYYSIGLVYAGVPEQPGTITSAGSADMVDSDSDGLTDNYELAYGGNPGVYDPGLDLDPSVADTDNDGLSDGDEVSVYLTSPLLIDTDNDGLSDGSEIANNSNPLIPDPDLDVDGVADSVDNCPLVPNLDQLDSDIDGTGDACQVEVTGIWPVNVNVGESESIFIFGSNFTTDIFTEVYFNGTRQWVVAPVSPEILVVRTTVALELFGPVTVTTPSDSATSAIEFGSPQSGLSITGIWPANATIGEAVSIFIFGSEFTTDNSMEVYFNGVRQWVVAPLSSELLVVRVTGASNLTGPVEIITPAGSVTSTEILTFEP